MLAVFSGHVELVTFKEMEEEMFCLSYHPDWGFSI